MGIKGDSIAMDINSLNHKNRTEQEINDTESRLWSLLHSRVVAAIVAGIFSVYGTYFYFTHTGTMPQHAIPNSSGLQKQQQVVIMANNAGQVNRPVVSDDRNDTADNTSSGAHGFSQSYSPSDVVATNTPNSLAYQVIGLSKLIVSDERLYQSLKDNPNLSLSDQSRARSALMLIINRITFIADAKRNIDELAATNPELQAALRHIEKLSYYQNEFKKMN